MWVTIMKFFYRIIRKVINMINEYKYGKIYWDVDASKYYEFTTFEETKEWGEKHYKRWAEQYERIMELSQKVINMSLCTSPIESYCGYTYRQINQFLRYGRDCESRLYREIADILTLVLSTAPRIPQDLVLYRMVNDEFINMLIDNNKKDKPTPTLEKGFMSTSLLKDIVDQDEPYANEENLLKIFAPKGTIGIYVNAVTARSEEEMLLFPNMYLGMAAYPYRDNDTGKMVYECELIKFY